MALYSKKDFAVRCKMTTKKLSVYIGRGQVILKGGLIPDTHDINKAFLEKHDTSEINDQPKTATLKNSQPKDQEKTAPIEIESDGTIPLFSVSERKLKHLQTVKIEVDIEKGNLDLAKKRGEVIPSELIKPVFIQHNQSIVTEFKNAAEEIIRSISKRKTLSVNEQAEIRGEMVSLINSSIKKATLLTVKSIDGIINEFIIKKGVGERNG